MGDGLCTMKMKITLDKFTLRSAHTLCVRKGMSMCDVGQKEWACVLFYCCICCRILPGATGATVQPGVYFIRLKFFRLAGNDIKDPGSFCLADMLLHNTTLTALTCVQCVRVPMWIRALSRIAFCCQRFEILAIYSLTLGKKSFHSECNG